MKKLLFPTKRYAATLAAVLAAAALVAGCSSPLRQQQTLSYQVTIEDEAVPMAAAAERTLVRKPTSDGTETYGNSSVSIDASNTSQGYVMVSYSGPVSKVKMQLTNAGKTTYTYNLKGGGKYEAFPLTSGNGSYTINVFENVSGNQYSLAYGTSIQVSLASSSLPFLYPSQYVNFTEASKTVAKGAELAKGAANELAIVSNVYNYVIKNISYDFNKAATVKSGYLPVVDDILASGTGICFDYAAVMTAMLRSQNIPTRLQVGYVSGGIYHAWISTYISDIGWVNNIIYFDGKNWVMMDPTFASSGNQSKDIMKFIGNGTNYSTQYVY